MPSHPASTPSEQAGRPRRRYAPRVPPGQRREQLLDAALNVIIAKGYGGVSVEAIARAVGVTRPVVYDHFPNLGRLLQALIEREEHYAVIQLEQVLPGDMDHQRPAELLARGVRRFLDAVASRPTTWRLILLPLEGTPEVVRRQVEMQRERMLERIEHLVRWAMQQGDFPRELDVELSARAIRDLGEQAGRQLLLDPDRYPPERYEGFVQSVVGLIWPTS